jgi:hypothetical protein
VRTVKPYGSRCTCARICNCDEMGNPTSLKCILSSKPQTNSRCWSGCTWWSNRYSASYLTHCMARGSWGQICGPLHLAFLASLRLRVFALNYARHLIAIKNRLTKHIDQRYEQHYNKSVSSRITLLEDMNLRQTAPNVPLQDTPRRPNPTVPRELLSISVDSWLNSSGSLHCTAPLKLDKTGRKNARPPHKPCQPPDLSSFGFRH